MAGVAPTRYTMQAYDPPWGQRARLYNGADASRVLEVLAWNGSKHCGDFCGDLPSISVSFSSGSWRAAGSKSPAFSVISDMQRCR
jgi:hypothetical protein